MILLSDHGISMILFLSQSRYFNGHVPAIMGFDPRSSRSKCSCLNFKTQSFVRFVIKSDNLHLEQKSNNDQIRALANPDQDLPMSLFGVCVQDFLKFSLFVNNASKNRHNKRVNILFAYVFLIFEYRVSKQVWPIKTYLDTL